ncbi:MAG: 1-deoxy-D-xylulose-5-phosphate reductoisomerase [Clostridiales bacterium]|nr:1-deoxy-D-xylulose-5-phosphate reductoisomerase [Clostridiales bacterium]
MKRLTILGSTGSIGRQALEVVDAYENKFEVVGLCCNSNNLIIEQIRKYSPKFVAVLDCDLADEIKSSFPNIQVLIGEEGICKLAEIKVDVLLNALVGISGLKPTIKAINAGNTIALANKETLVAGGELVMPFAKKKGVEILPVDSEHSAIWQCIGEKNLSKILLTASGGAFRDWTKTQLEDAKACDALKHPNWDMGAKVTIDSATLMNKGLEIIEAMHLFGVDVDDIKVLVHRQSVVHSMVEYADGSVIAQMSYPDMRLPIQIALLYPERGDYAFQKYDFIGKSLTFEDADEDRFPCLAIAKYCAKEKGIAPLIMNASNEILVKAYLDNKIKFYDIPYYIRLALDKFYQGQRIESEEQIYEIDGAVRTFVEDLINKR